MKVAVVGLGYVGLPLAILCARKGLKTVGLEINQDIVDKVNSGRSHFKDDKVEASLKEALPNLHATTKLSEVADCNVYIICVPTPVDEDKKPDAKPLVSAADAIGKYVKKGDLVVVESTVYPGTCEEIVQPILEKLSGLNAGREFFFSHCPERVNPGDVFWEVANIPRVVGGLTQECTDRTAEFYQRILGGKIFDVSEIRDALRPKFIAEGEGYRINSIPLGTVTKMHSLRDAEAVKAMENTIRDVNIAMVNELAKISEVLHLDVIDIVEGMATKPFGKGPFYPGIGVGGHCIAVDPEWLKEASVRAGYYPEIISLARKTNNGMPEYAINLLKNALGKELMNTKIAIMGVSYKGNIDDPRESPFYEVKHILQKKGAKIAVFDPYYTKDNTSKDVSSALQAADAALIVTDHNLFREKLTPAYLKAHGIKVVIDGRNCLDKEGIIKEGIVYRGIGK